MSVNWILLLSILPGAIAVWICTYIFVIKHVGKAERCTTHTTGMIIRYSSVNYAGVHIPLVEYLVNEKRYKIAGPKFTGCVVKRVSTPFNSAKAVNKSNLTTREELPKTLRVTIYKNSVASVEYTALSDLYPVHSQVDVYYNPDKPRDAFVQRDEGISKVLAIVFGTFSIVFLLVMLGCLAWPFITMN